MSLKCDQSVTHTLNTLSHTMITFFFVYYCISIIHAQNGSRLVSYECVLTISTDLLVVSVAYRVDYNDICGKLVEDVLLVQ